MKFSVIEDAFDFVSFSDLYEHTALISRTTGHVFQLSEGIELEEETELPLEILESPDYVAVPDKNDLDLGQRVVWQFVEREIPDRADTVRSFFTRARAYARFKAYLEEIGLLDRWFEFETARSREALLAWCKDEGLKVEDEEEVTRAIQGALRSTADRPS